jgi:catalase
MRWRRTEPGGRVGAKIEEGVRAKTGELDPKAAEQANPAREGMQAKA